MMMMMLMVMILTMMKILMMMLMMRMNGDGARFLKMAAGLSLKSALTTQLSLKAAPRTRPSQLGCFPSQPLSPTYRFLMLQGSRSLNTGN